MLHLMDERSGRKVKSGIKEHEVEVLKALKVLGFELDCDDNERWNSGHQYAVVKKNAERATAVFDNLKDAQNKCGAGYYVETRAGEDLNVIIIVM